MDEAKKLGDVAYNDKNWVEAIKQYSASIDLKEATSSVKVLRSLYSNRSATYLEQKQFTAALLDADECIKLDSDWAKGHSRRGGALYSLRRWADSEASYTRAEALEPGKGYREKAQKASQAAAYQERAARQQQAGSSSGGVMGTSIPKAPTDGILKILYGAAEKGMFLLYFFFSRLHLDIYLDPIFLTVLSCGVHF